MKRIVSVKVSSDLGTYEETIERAESESWSGFYRQVAVAIEKACDQTWNEKEPDFIKEVPGKFIGVAAEPRKRLLDEFIGNLFNLADRVDDLEERFESLTLGSLSRRHLTHTPSDAIPVSSGPCIMEIEPEKYGAPEGCGIHAYFDQLGVIDVVGQENAIRLLNGELHWEIHTGSKGSRMLHLVKTASGRPIHWRDLDDA